MPTRKDHEFISHVMKEFYNQKAPAKTIVKLPCGHGKLELARPKDTFLQCPKCKHQFMYVHSMVNKRIYADS